MNGNIKGKRVAILAADGFEQTELMGPKKALEEAGAETVVVSPNAGQIKGWKDKQWADSIPVDQTLDNCSAEDFDALLLPGGLMSPDRLRMNEQAIAFTREFAEAGKPIGAICHGPWTLIEAGAVEGRKMTSWPAIKSDLENAGAEWVDEEVVTDNGLVTSRKPEDVPAFSKKLIEEISEGVHARAM